MKLFGKRRRPGAGLFLLCANLGLVSFSFLAIVYVAGLASPLLNLLLVAAALVLQLALLGLFLTRRSDEYVEALWNSATSAAFAGLVLGMIATQVGFAFIGHEAATREQSDQLHNIPLTLPFLFFFVVLSLQRIRRSR